MKGMLFFMVVSLAMVFAADAAAAQTGQIIAVFELEDRGVGLPPQVIDNLTSYLSVKLAECGYQVIPREQIRERLLEQKKESYKQCYDQNCQIELGRELAAQKMLSSQILKIGSTCKMTSTIFDLRRAAAERAASAGAGCVEDSLLQATEKIAASLCRTMRHQEGASDKAASEFDAALREAQKIKEYKDRVMQAWLAAKNMASDMEIPIRTRGELLRKFLQEFKEKNPYRDEAQALLADLLPATLEVDTQPRGAEVLIDGTPAGRAPLYKSLKAGVYVLSARLAGYRAEDERVKLEPGRKTSIEIAMTELPPGSLVVKTDPQGADIKVNDKVLGKSPLKVGLRCGNYLVSVEKPDYERVEKKVAIAAGESTELVLSLSRIYPMNPYKKWGHVTFWSGVGLAAFGGIAAGLAVKAGDDYEAGDTSADEISRTWTGVMLASLGAGAAGMVTGLVLWVLSPGDKEWFEKHGTGVTLVPAETGASLSLCWEW